MKFIPESRIDDSELYLLTLFMKVNFSHSNYLDYIQYLFDTNSYYQLNMVYTSFKGY